MGKKVTKVADKLAKVDENFTINMYDNGYMIEIGGRDANDDWKTAKILISSMDDLVQTIRDITEMDRT